MNTLKSLLTRLETPIIRLKTLFLVLFRWQKFVSIVTQHGEKMYNEGWNDCQQSISRRELKAITGKTWEELEAELRERTMVA